MPPALLVLVALGAVACSGSDARTQDARPPPPPSPERPRPLEPAPPPPPPPPPPTPSSTVTAADLGPHPVVWRAALRDFCFPRALHLHAGTLLVCCDDVYALDAETGAVRARVELGPASCESAVPDGDALLVAANVLVMFGNDVQRRASYVTRIDVRGRTTWRRDLEADRIDAMHLEPDGSLLVVGRFRDRPEPDHSALYRLVRATGAVTSSRPLRFVASDALTAGGRLLIARPSTPGLIEWRDGTEVPISERTALRLVVAGDRLAVRTRTDLFAAGPRETWVEVRDLSTLDVLFARRGTHMDFDGEELIWIEERGGRRVLTLTEITRRRNRWQRPIARDDSGARFYGPYVLSKDHPSDVHDRRTGRVIGTADWWAYTPPVAAGDRLYVGLTQQVACVSGVTAEGPSRAPRGSARE